MPMVYWQDWSSSSLQFESYVNDTLYHSKRLSFPTEVIPVFSVANNAWNTTLSEDEIQSYMHQCGQMSKNNGIKEISYFYFSQWSSNQFDRVKASYVSPVPAVTPGFMEFIDVPIGNSVTQVFTIQNVGKDVLDISVSTSSPLSIVGDSEFSLAEDQTASVTIEFTASDSNLFESYVTFSGENFSIVRKVIAKEFDSCTTTVPNVLNMTRDDAVGTLLLADLMTGNVSYECGSLPVDLVISQDPTVGTEVLCDTTINIVLSTGACLVSVPDVLDISQASAESEIVAAGLTVGTITKDCSDTVVAGNVISQNPAGGSSVAISSAVNLVISLGNDSDTDGLPDTWEQQIIDADPYDDISFSEDVDPKDDFDGDGYSNLRELISETDPTSLNDIPSCIADFDDDGDVDGLDLAVIKDELADQLCPCLSDFNNDGDVDETDLFLFSEEFGRVDDSNIGYFEDFEKYTTSTWPSSDWIKDANAVSDPSNNVISSDPANQENKVLKLSGAIGSCWAALAYKPLPFPRKLFN